MFPATVLTKHSVLVSVSYIVLVSVRFSVSYIVLVLGEHKMAQRLLQCFFRDVTHPLAITEITLSRMTVALVAILESELCSPAM